MLTIHKFSGRFFEVKSRSASLAPKGRGVRLVAGEWWRVSLWLELVKARGQRRRGGQGFPEKKAGRWYREKPLENTAVEPLSKAKIPFQRIEKRSVTIKDLSKLFSNKFE